MTDWQRADYAINADGYYEVAFNASSLVSEGGIPPNYGAFATLYLDNVHIIIPEPATIGLLTLGGLLLRRKK